MFSTIEMLSTKDIRELPEEALTVNKSSWVEEPEEDFALLAAAGFCFSLYFTSNLLSMRDNHEGMPEIIGAFEEDGRISGSQGVEIGGALKKDPDPICCRLRLRAQSEVCSAGS